MLKSKFCNYLFVFLLAIVFCQLAVADTVDVTGDWQGTWNSSYYLDNGGISVHVTQSGISVNGTLDLTNTACGNLADLPLTGTVSENILSLDSNVFCDDSNNTLQYRNGIISGNYTSGNYTVYADGDLWDYGTFSMTRSVNIITASAGPGGSISPSGLVSVNAGSSRTFIISPDSGYDIADVKVDGSSVGSVSTYAFSNLQANHTIAASFSESIPAPVANFSADTIIGKSPLTVNFMDESTGDITSRNWNFGDGSSSTVQNPSHTYNSLGTYTVSLTVTGPGGSDSDTEIDFITVEAPVMPGVPLLLLED